jgi:hypothetical protein
MDVFLAMLADKDSSLRKVFQNLNVDERYFYPFSVKFITRANPKQLPDKVLLGSSHFLKTEKKTKDF